MRPSENIRPKYSDLARSKAQINRSIQPSECPRLLEVVENVTTIQLSAEFWFVQFDASKWRGDAGLGQVLCCDMTIAAACRLDCQLCEELLDRHIETEVEALIVVGESAAEVLAERVLDSDFAHRQIIVVGTDQFDGPALVEDELMLALPSQVCTDVQCLSRPELVFAGSEEDVTDAARTAQDTENSATGYVAGDEQPFAGLEELRKSLRTTARKDAEKP